MKNRTKNTRAWGMAIFSGALMAAGYEPWNMASLAWIAWVPLLSQLLPTGPDDGCARPFQLGFVAGLVFWFSTIYWLVHVSFVAMVAFAIYLALFIATWAWWMGWLR